MPSHRALLTSFAAPSLEITKMIISQRWRRFRYRSLMRFKGRKVLYVPGVVTMHVSTYAMSSVRQRHSRGPPPPRGCPPQEAACRVLPRQPLPTHRTDKTTTTTVTNFEPPISESFKSTAHNSDVEDTETDKTHQVSLSESSAALRYGPGTVFHCEFSRFLRFFTIFRVVFASNEGAHGK